LTAIAALFVVAILGTTVWRTAPAPPGPPVRLAVLPLAAGTGTDAGRAPATSAGVAEDVAEQLSGRRRNFTVMPPAEMTLNRVDSAAKARTVLGASHVLVTRVHETNSVMALDATLIDLESGQALRELSGTYAVGEPPAIVKALVAMVTEAFRLPRAGPQESVTGPAAVPYSKGVALLRESGRTVRPQWRTLPRRSDSIRRPHCRTPASPRHNYSAPWMMGVTGWSRRRPRSRRRGV